VIARILIGIVGLYRRLLSPILVFLFGKVCRFEPSCSRYALICLETHGAARGSLLSIVRLCKCHPFHPGGFDPPPPLRPKLRGDKSPLRTSAHGP
jgi:putative membrane protein insertion efficiency factor